MDGADVGNPLGPLFIRAAWFVILGRGVRECSEIVDSLLLDKVKRVVLFLCELFPKRNEYLERKLPEEEQQRSSRRGKTTLHSKRKRGEEGVASSSACTACTPPQPFSCGG